MVIIFSSESKGLRLRWAGVGLTAAADVKCLADKAYRGAGGTVRTPYRGRWETLSTGQRAVSRFHAKIRALVEQAMAALEA
ncbi:hypothetical protein GCM10019016_104780 [Streptomyces prasinosporus]|uniref:Transposase n=1 Tax=Streptomyces prasinosporus TaxID=68256 RepID=A0ABP6U9J1_9ACTN